MQTTTNISEENAASIFSWEKYETNVVYTTSGRNNINQGTELANWMSGYKKAYFPSMKPKVQERFPFAYQEGMLGEWR